MKFFSFNISKRYHYPLYFLLAFCLLINIYFWTNKITGLFLTLKQPNIKLNSEILKQNTLIAHSMGSVGNTILICSEEAFLNNYQKGARVFEVDLRLTKDTHIVCFHEGTTKVNLKNIDYQEFSSYFQDRQYSPLDLDKLMSLLNEFPDIALIFDVKYDKIDNYEIYNQVIDQITNHPLFNEQTKSRIIIQTYNEYNVKKIIPYNFSEIIYRPSRINKQALDMIKKYNIHLVSVNKNDFDSDMIRNLNKVDAFVLLHTVDDPLLIKKYRGLGVYGFFTDFFETN